MEITAVLEAVRTLEGPLQVVSDSTYVINCFRDRWWEGWLRRGWINGKKQPVANRDLWEPLIEIVRLREVAFRWVKGHSGDPMNDLVDRLAVGAARTQRGEQGVAPNGIPASPPAARSSAERCSMDSSLTAVSASEDAFREPPRLHQ
jgi:ribonuclease HI